MQNYFGLRCEMESHEWLPGVASFMQDAAGDPRTVCAFHECHVGAKMKLQHKPNQPGDWDGRKYYRISVAFLLAGTEGKTWGMHREAGVCLGAEPGRRARGQMGTGGTQK